MTSEVYSLRFEKERLATFVEWPLSFIRPEDLARDGFYHYKIEDRCVCIFCGIIVGRWEEGDTPRGEHLRHSPRCKFINGEAVGNVKIDYPYQYKFVDEINGYSEGCFPTPFQEPRHKYYIFEEKRLASFDGRWVATCQDPRALAGAGFFYSGVCDFVRCYHCNCAVRNWKSTDDPMKVHAERSPRCTFVLLMDGPSKDEIFIQKYVDCRRKGLPLPPPPEDDDDDEKILDMDVVQKVLEKYPRPLVKRIVAAEGKPFFSVRGLEGAIEGYLKGCNVIFNVSLFVSDSGCVVCFAAPTEVIFYPCGHLVCCRSCTLRLQKGRENTPCIVCRIHISDVILKI